jgi:hypothetical protein
LWDKAPAFDLAKRKDAARGESKTDNPPPASAEAPANENLSLERRIDDLNKQVTWWGKRAVLPARASV